MELVSPLLGRPLPDLAGVLAWCDAGARAILEGAVRLASWRREHDAPPRVHAVEPSRDVTRTDVLRALVALCPDALGLSAIRDLALGDAPVRWRRAIDASQPGPAALERTLARAWLLERTRDPATPLGPRAIAGALGFEGALALTAFDAQYGEGLITRRESACRILDDQARADRGMSSRAPVLPVFCDRDGALAQLDAALASAPGVVIVADGRERGRHALVEAWLQRQLYEHTPLPAAASTLAALDVRRINRDFFGSWDDALLYGLAGGVRGAHLELREAVGYRPGWVDDLAVVAERATDTAHKMIVTITRQREGELAEAHPLFATLPRVEVSRPGEADWLVLWWCQLPLLERRVGTRASLPELIEAFARASDAERSRADWRTVALALARVRSEHELDVRLDPGPPPWARWRRALRRDRGADELAFLARYVGSPDRIRALVAADAQLT